MLNNEEKKELKKLAASASLRNDMAHIKEFRHNPFVISGTVDMDKFLAFLTEFNQFINHSPKPFRRIIDSNMRL